jgi:hypothetical protein
MEMTTCKEIFIFSKQYVYSKAVFYLREIPDSNGKIITTSFFPKNIDNM